MFRASQVGWNMNIKELIDYVFGDEWDQVEFLDAADAPKPTIGFVPSDAISLDDVRARLNIPCLDLVTDEKVFAVVTDKLPLEQANILVSSDSGVVGLYALENPVAPDSVPESWDIDVLVTPDVTFSYGDNGDFHDLSLLLDQEFLDNYEGESGDVPDDDSVSEIPVSVSDEGDDTRAPETSSQDTQYLNDAEILGADHPDLAEFLEQPMVFMTGDLFPADNRRSTRDGDWKRVEMPLIGWINGGDGWGLSKHPEGRTKDGASIVPSENIDGARKDSAVKTMYAIGIDIDSGTSLEHVLDRLEDEGIFSVVYTTYNHRKTEFELKHDDVMRKMKLEETPNRAQVQEYLRLHHATRFDRDFISKIEIVEARKQTKDGMRIVLKTPPIDKFRVVIPLAEPVELADLAPTLAQWKDIWADKVAGVCRNMLDAHFDVASCDVNRLFYTPRHPKGDDNWYSAVVMGRPLTFDEIEPYSKAKYVRERSPTGDPFLAGSESTGEQEMFLMPDSGKSLNDWHRKAKSRFLIADAIEAHAADKVRVAGGERDGTIHIECPFEHEHSSSGGTATMVMNPHANEKEYWTVFCHHDSCKGRNKLEFLQQMLQDEWFPESVLEDEEFLLMDEEETSEEQPEENDPFAPVTEAAKFNERTQAEDIKRFMKRQLRMNVDAAVKAAITKKLVEVTALGKRGINDLWKEVTQERQAKEREAAAEDIENFEGYPVVNMWDFKKMVEWAVKRIQAHNAQNPSLFHYMDGVARVRQNAQGKWHIHILSKDEFAAELNHFTTWNHQTMLGDQVRTRGVSAPEDVVKSIYFDIDAVYPPLRGLITSPAFTAQGELITEPGYHDSGLYYAPDLTLDIPAISDKPTDDEVDRALQLIVEEALADFPFAGLTRDEIVKEVLEGDGVPAVTHVLSMLLLFFCRDLIDGPTPGHLLGKPAPGTGASLLTDVISTIATGSVTPASAMPSNSDEMGKTITALLASGTNMIFFDNINHGVDSAELASAITSPEYKARILGKSELVDTEVRCIWTLTGNNVQLSSEILRRCVLIDLDAQSAEPEKRSGWRHDDIRAWVKENRGELVWACLMLIQNWIAQGKPLYKKEALNSFENWSGVMGGILECAGVGGFLGNRQELKAMASDGRENDIVVLLEEWWEAKPGLWVPSRSSDEIPISLISIAISKNIQLSVRKVPDADGEMTYNSQQFEAFLTKYQNRVFRLADGVEVRLEKSKESKRNGYEWRLKPMVEDVSNI